jgi:RHS repeat-associated protein
MSNSSSSAAEVISLPQGGGALQGIGEKFSPDLHTGTGNFTVPIALPPGRNGFQPQLNLVYSTGNGNGPFGLGWVLSVPGVSRKTSQGVPLYDDSRDTFILSGSEDLVPMADGPPGATRYRPRTEGLFALIDHYRDRANDYWKVQSKDGLVSVYGVPGQSGHDPAVVADPSDRDKALAWKLTQTRDPFGNIITYEYERDSGGDEQHSWDQLYLRRIRYVDYEQDGETEFLVSATFEYEARPDAFSDHRPGFEVRTRKRCTRIETRTHAGQDILVRTLSLVYLDQRSDLDDLGQRLPPNNVSLLSQIVVTGHDGDLSEELPPLEFGYTRFEPRTRKFFPLQGTDLPAASLANPDVELVDLFGQGLPDLLETNGEARYWRNRGDGRFDLPRVMDTAPAGLHLSDPAVQLVDADGDGRTDLLVTTGTLVGYYPLRFGGLWDRRSFQPYRFAPSFGLKDPEVRLVDLDGDGVTDAIRAGSRLECFFNDPKAGWNETRRVERPASGGFPGNFSDPRVNWADMTGDGLQDVVLVHNGHVEYWPSLGRGNWGKRVSMSRSPHFPDGYDPKRILLGDVDGDGLADLVYVEDTKITLWMNQNGNGWSEPVVIKGTPPVTDRDAVRLADMLGNGIRGVLWSRDADGLSPASLFFLDFTGGVKPYLLSEMDNHMGAVTRVGYAPSTRFYLDDQKRRETRWQTPLPFPVQVVAQVEVIDAISGGKLTTEYSYHHGYWDGAEREFRGFARVDQRDTETFEAYHGAGLHPDRGYNPVPPHAFSPPTETRTWFHQGPIGDEFGDWSEMDCSGEFWPGDVPLFSRPQAVNDLLKSLDRRARRDALRALRGNVLRTEFYALDGTERQGRPYTVTESQAGLREESPPGLGEAGRRHIFFPHLLAQQTTQWERGDDPMTQYTFTDDYDEVGQPRQKSAVAPPRRSARRQSSQDSDETRILATHTRTAFARADAGLFLGDRVAQVRTFELTNPPGVAETDPNDVLRVLADQASAAGAIHRQFRTLLDPWRQGQPVTPEVHLISHIVNHYDGSAAEAYLGRPAGELGPYGALVRSESLAFTDAELDAALGEDRPDYLGGRAGVPAGAPGGFPGNLGYRRERRASSGYHDGYYFDVRGHKFDFQDNDPPAARGVVIGVQDSLGHESTIRPDGYRVLPAEVTNAAGLTTTAAYNYRVLQPNEVTDPNGNRTAYTYTPLGLLSGTSVRGKLADHVGDETRPSVEITYDLLAFDHSPPDARRPVSARTRRYVHHDTETDVPLPERDESIDAVQYSDGFGRLLQTRTQAEDLLFDDLQGEAPVVGTAGLPADPGAPTGRAIGRVRAAPDPPNVVVSGWQTYDNKGQVVEKYEPFFARGWDFAPPADSQLGQKATLTYDPRGRLVVNANPDGSEQRVIVGVPIDLSDPDHFTPTPWETYTYDANDNAGRTHPGVATAYEHHWNTPASTLVDALGRTIETVERHRSRAAVGQPLSPIHEYRGRSSYDIQGNLLAVTDALGREVFRHFYDLIKRPLRAVSIDAGTRLTVLDASSNPVEQRDGRGVALLRTYDVLNRPTALFARDGDTDPLTLRERIEYGDGGDPDQPPDQRAEHRDSNRLGKPYRHYDEAGLLAFEIYDFKGNPLEKSRRVLSDGELLTVFAGAEANHWQIPMYRVDWRPPDGTSPSDHANQLLDATVYLSSTTYDALNRIKILRYPQDVTGERKLLQPTYNRAGALERVALGTEVQVDHIAYNAKGQRILIAYGNQLMTRSAYDPRSFRLVRLRTEPFQAPGPNDYQPAGTPLQDYAYDYDLIGNVLQITDRVPGSGFLNNPDAARVQGSDPALARLLASGDALVRYFEYDSLYRLTRATGREATNIPGPRPWRDDPRSGFNSGTSGTPSPSNAPQLTTGYWESYAYDPAGNLIAMQHASGAVASWIRNFGIGGFTPAQWDQQWQAHLGAAGGWPTPPGNQLTHVGDDTRAFPATHLYDASGNLVQEATSRHFEWDHSDRMRVFRSQTLNAPPSVYAHYLYDSGGQRVKKLVRTATNRYDVTVYIDGIFEHHRQVTPKGTMENNSLHVLDNRRRIALVRAGDAFPDDGAPEARVKYHLSDHLGSSTLVAGGATSSANGFINREEYFPYGETSFGSFGRKRYRFTGKERDEESGLYYHGSRYYAPWLARWMSFDPAGYEGSSNLYLYVGDNPLAYSDPTGSNGEPPEGYLDLKVGPYSDVEGHHIAQSKVYTASPQDRDPFHGVALAISQKAGEGDFTTGMHKIVSKGQVLWNKANAGRLQGEETVGGLTIRSLGKGTLRGTGWLPPTQDTVALESAYTLIGAGVPPKQATELAERAVAQREELGSQPLRLPQFPGPRNPVAGFVSLDLLTLPYKAAGALAGVAKETVKSLIPGSDFYDYAKFVGGGSFVAGARVIALGAKDWLATVTASASSALRVALGSVATAIRGGVAALTAEVPAGAAGSAGVTGAAILGAVGSVTLLGFTIKSAVKGEETPIDVADQFYGTHFGDISGWVTGQYSKR